MAGGAAKSGPASGGGALEDEICFDRRYFLAGQEVRKEDQQLQERLENVVEGEIIPRLMLLHQDAETAGAAHRNGTRRTDVADHLADFTQIVLTQEADVAAAYVNALLHRGVKLEAVLLQLMAPAARRLGELWTADAIDFVDVTVATSRLQQVLHRFTFEFEKSAHLPARRVLLLPTPSEQHTFGLLMVSEFFRREGWHVVGAPVLERDELRALVAEQWFALIGFSLSCERLLDTLRSTINDVRKFSKNLSVQIIVGGNIFSRSPELRPAVGADLAVGDVREAIKLAESALESSAGRPM
ncbi:MULTISPECIES: cobalamin B12-binding domain-containing protein [Rhodomicrobium]|uniref:cobalamin B12-binding domain-containing protein n=1 Tax=Rhodomicrobium TaxID=1068 RepID=UPI001482750D|nr:MULTISPECIES: cobalamin B12-binding domain-containing protein [Rhodomicrobium]